MAEWFGGGETKRTQSPIAKGQLRGLLRVGCSHTELRSLLRAPRPSRGVPIFPLRSARAPSGREEKYFSENISFPGPLLSRPVCLRGSRSVGFVAHLRAPDMPMAMPTCSRVFTGCTEAVTRVRHSGTSPARWLGEVVAPCLETPSSAPSHLVQCVPSTTFARRAAAAAAPHRGTHNARRRCAQDVHLSDYLRVDVNSPKL